MKNISDNPFWHYSVHLWPTAGESLLMLQDSYQLDINMVLYCCWLAEEKANHSFIGSTRELLA